MKKQYSVVRTDPNTWEISFSDIVIGKVYKRLSDGMYNFIHYFPCDVNQQLEADFNFGEKQLI